MEKKKISQNTRYRRTQKGLIITMYTSEIQSCKRRNVEPPNYTLKEFRKKLRSDENFLRLFKEWKASGYETDLKPSGDRIDPTKGYTLDNLQIITWKENYDKGVLERSGANNYKARGKDEKYYSENVTERSNFKKVCKTRGWNFENFEEIEHIELKPSKKRYTYKLLPAYAGKLEL